MLLITLQCKGLNVWVYRYPFSNIKKLDKIEMNYFETFKCIYRKEWMPIDRYVILIQKLVLIIKAVRLFISLKWTIYIKLMQMLKYKIWQLLWTYEGINGILVDFKFFISLWVLFYLSMN